MKIVCLGDSITSGYGVRRGESWIELLNARSRHQLINAGIAGDTASGMLARLRSDVFPHKPCMAIIMGGYNDIFLQNGFDCAKSHIAAIAHQCVSAGIVPVIGIPIPIMPHEPNPWSSLMDSKRAVQLADDYCDWLKCFAKVFCFSYIDLHTPFKAYVSERGSNAYLSDGIHPSAAGHLLIAREIESFLSERFGG